MSRNPPIEVKLISTFYLLTGLIDLLIFYDTKFRLFTVAILALLCFITAIGIMKLKRWALHLAGISALLQGEVCIVTLYTSINMLGFNPNIVMMLFNTGLLIWTFFIVAMSCLLFLRRKIFSQ